MATVGFPHTSPVHVPTFDALVAEAAPGTSVLTVVDEALLERARVVGPGDDEICQGVAAHIDHLRTGGATTIVCTCSTIGDVAERIGAELGRRVIRVDRPMAERAVGIGGRVAVLAALESTLGPTRDLLQSVARKCQAEAAIEIHLVDGAWERFEAGDTDGYCEVIADALPRLAESADVIVLAQASMAAAADGVDLDVPVLSSPRLAVEALVAFGV